MPIIGLLMAAQLLLSPLSVLADNSSSGATMEIPQSTSTNQTCSVATDLSLGDRGDVVTCLQKNLLADGLLGISAPTGYFGPMTKSAVMKWQSMHGVAATGFFGSLSIPSIKPWRIPTKQ